MSGTGAAWATEQVKRLVAGAAASTQSVKTGSSTLESLQRLAQAATLHPKQEELVKLCEALGNDSRLNHLTPETLFATAKSILAQNPKSIENAVSVAHGMLIGGNTDPALARVRNSGVTPSVAEREIVMALNTTSAGHGGSGSSFSYAMGTNPVSSLEKFSTQVKSLATEHQVSLGLSCLLAGLSAISSASQFAHAVQTDGEGNRHVNSLRLLMGGASALLAAGMAYLTHAQFKGAVAAR